MITKEQFTQLINWNETQEKEVDKLCKVFPDAFDSKIINNTYALFELVLDICFDEEGIDWITWWLYDSINLDGTLNRTYIEDGKTISVETIDELWELVKGYRK